MERPRHPEWRCGRQCHAPALYIRRSKSPSLQGSTWLLCSASLPVESRWRTQPKLGCRSRPVAKNVSSPSSLLFGVWCSYLKCHSNDGPPEKGNARSYIQGGYFTAQGNLRRSRTLRTRCYARICSGALHISNQEKANEIRTTSLTRGSSTCNFAQERGSRRARFGEVRVVIR